MKKLTAFLLAVVLILSLTSCTASKVKINGTKIDNEIHTYFESSVSKNDKGEVSEEDVLKAISRYVAVNSEFEIRGLSLDSSIKSEVSTAVNDLWHIYGSYYEELGISKQTVYKIELSKAYEDALLSDYYSEKGDHPVSEEDIKNYFKENYCAIRFVTGYLFNVDDKGNPVTMTDAEKTKLKSSFDAVAESINGGIAIEEAVGTLGENTEVHNTIVNAFSDGTYPDGFFDAVKKIEQDKTQVITIENYIFLVSRIDVFSSEYGYFNTYRTHCLKQMKGEEFKAVVDKWAESYKSE